MVILIFADTTIVKLWTGVLTVSAVVFGVSAGAVAIQHQPKEVNKVALVIGGAGEPPGRSTMFDVAFNSVGHSLKKGGYTTQVVFDGGHAITETLAEKHFPKSRKDVTGENIGKALSTLQTDLREGRLKAGDQLLILNLNHGLRPDGSVGAHRVSAHGGSFDMEELKALRDEAERAGVKLAIVDQSCYSGASLTLASPKTCVISVSDRNTVGYSSDFEAFWANASTGKSLEENFLRARLKVYPAASPGISGEPGRKTQELLKAVQKHLVHEKGDLRMQFGRPRDCENCFQAESPPLVTGLGIGEIALKAVLPERELGRLKERIEKYRNIYRELEREWSLERKLANNALKIGEKSLRWEYLANFDMASEKAVYKEHQREAKTQEQKDFWKNAIEHLGEIERKRNALSANIEYRRYLQLRKKVNEQSDALLKAAKGVSRSERELYDAIYRSFREERPNPCADFLF